MSQGATNPLLGLRILIAEDNWLIGEAVQQILMDLGCVVVGPFDDVGEVLASIRTTAMDGALLDVQLGDANILPAASELASRAIPFILATGRGSLADLPELLANAPLLSKPFDASQLERLVRSTFLPRIDA
jgi:DNA-binding response OmpR family regulator